MFFDGSLELFLGDFFVTVGVNHLEDFCDILFPSSSEFDSVLFGMSLDGFDNLLQAPFSIIVSVDGEVLGIQKLFLGNSTVTIFINLIAYILDSFLPVMGKW